MCIKINRDRESKGSKPTCRLAKGDRPGATHTSPNKYECSCKFYGLLCMFVSFQSIDIDIGVEQEKQVTNYELHPNVCDFCVCSKCTEEPTFSKFFTSAKFLEFKRWSLIDAEVVVGIRVKVWLDFMVQLA